MTEAEWLTATVGLLLMQETDGKVRDEDGSPMWRLVAVRVACLDVLGLERAVCPERPTIGVSSPSPHRVPAGEPG
jgi:hypothetical protein